MMFEVVFIISMLLTPVGPTDRRLGVLVGTGAGVTHTDQMEKGHCEKVGPERNPSKSRVGIK